MNVVDFYIIKEKSISTLVMNATLFSNAFSCREAYAPRWKTQIQTESNEQMLQPW